MIAVPPVGIRRRAAMVPAAGSPHRDEILLGDAASTLALRPAASVPLAMTSPPYNAGIPYRRYADDLHPDE